jgi:hypothetical protein
MATGCEGAESMLPALDTLFELGANCEYRLYHTERNWKLTDQRACRRSWFRSRTVAASTS